jgi:phosphatidylserine/phosphatidylglycerophosphate/cardiolipin synthase-like enzyme
VTRRYTPIERIGINAVERVILRFGWIFREQAKVDFGIDALVETCEEGEPSGRSIALQIKSGESFFRERSARGVIYRDSKAHFDYWLGHSLPVALVLYHPGHDEAWWCPITPETVGRTPKGGRLTVPGSQRLDESSRSAIAIFARPELSRRRAASLDLQLASSRSVMSLSSMLDALAMAKDEIDIASQFIDKELLSTLSAISCCGVRVRLLTSQYSAETLWDEAQSSLLHVRLGRRNDIALHSKLIAVDRRFAIQGSANFTAFAWQQPAERVLVSVDLKMVTEICTSFEEVWRASIECG